MNWLKKVVLAAGLSVLGGATAFGAAGWVGCGAIHVGPANAGTWYANENDSRTSWCTGGEFDGADLGSFTTALPLAGQVRLWDTGNADWGSSSWAYMKYRIDDGAWEQLTLAYLSYDGNDHHNYFQSGGSTFTATDIDLTELTDGEHELSVYFVDVDGLKSTPAVTATFTSSGNVAPGEWKIFMDPSFEGTGTTVQLGEWFTLKFCVGIDNGGSTPARILDGLVTWSKILGDEGWEVPAAVPPQGPVFEARMRETGDFLLMLRAEFIDEEGFDRTLEAEYELYVIPPLQGLGECWHEPAEYPAGWSTQMRLPLEPTAADTNLAVFVGNYQSYADDGANMTGGIVHWSGGYEELEFASEQEAEYGGKLKFWKADLDISHLGEGDTLSYWIEVEYANRNPTYLGTTNQTNGVIYAGDWASENPFVVVVGAVPARDPGNIWHHPGNYEPWGSAAMRDPLEPEDGARPFLRLGGYPNNGNESMTSASVWYKINDGSWTELALGGEDVSSSTNSSNAYWTNALPQVSAGDSVAYYFEGRFANSSTLGTTYACAATNSQLAGTTTMDEAAAQASPFTFTVAVRTPHLGNCWHVPGQYEPWAGATMRNPAYPSAGEAICVFVGNQAYGEGNRGDMTGGKLWHRAVGASAWNDVDLVPENRPDWEDPAWLGGGNNIYWKGIIPAGTYASAGDMEYYLEVQYLNDYHDTTYLGTTNTWRSTPFASAAEAQAHPFSCPIGDTAGSEPGYMWHAGNAVVAGTNAVQFWVKIGYTKGGVDWADTVQLRYKFESGSVPRGAVKSGRTAKKAMSRALTGYETAAFVRDHEEEDSSDHGNAVWWACTLTDNEFMDSGKYLAYEIVAKNSQGNDTWRWADYRTGSATNLFYYTMFQAGSGALTVNGLNADYTTSKFFIDEAAGDAVTLEIDYEPPVDSPYAVEVFSNVGRRDYWDSDIDHDGVVDSIRPPNGDFVVAGMQDEANEPIHTNRPYFAAWPMEHSGTGYHKTLVVTNTGAYRLTARYKETAASGWVYYSAITNSLRDHAIMVSPKKVLQQNVYEVNGMTAKAQSATEAGHSTFIDLIEGTNDFSEFGIPYLNGIQANCLWFQPIHTSSESGLGPDGEPGSPYAAKDYFSVSKWYGKSGTTAGALGEFQSFVAACDAGRSPSMSTSYVGTINIMLDGVFNHTSWDAVFGVMGEQMGLVAEGAGATTAIASVKPGWYANCSDYGLPATWYTGPGWGNHDIACGPDRGDFGKWEDTAELFYGRYSALVRHNPDNNGDYLNEDDQYDYTSMSEDTELLWKYMGSYVPYWLEKTGHAFGNERMGEVDANGIAYDDYGIDGLRCDFGQGLPPQFWEYCINRARAKKWNFMFMAESLDGGKVSYRSNRHFDILNESFVFAARNAGSPRDLVGVLNEKKAAYNGGTILLNLTSHDEVMPYTDAWKTASRYAMLATVKGLPMTMYGQEQGIIPCNWGTGGFGEGTIITNIVSGDDFTAYGFDKFELNFGKWVADFKTWNKLSIWERPPLGEAASRGMAQLYGRINWARLNSPALQSDKEYLMNLKDGGDSGAVWAMAKVDRPAALQGENPGDAVLAFVRFINDDHNRVEETFKIADGVDAFLGLEDAQEYMVRNIASSDASANVWDAPKTGAELKAQGITVELMMSEAPTMWSDGAMVQFLKIEKYVAPVPVTHTITVTAGSNGSVSPDGEVVVEDGASQAFTVTADTGYRIESVLADDVTVATFGNEDTTYTYTWTNVTANGTLSATFVEQSVEPTVVPSAGGVDVPVGWMEGFYPGMTYEQMLVKVDETAANGKDAVWQCYIAALDPTDADAAMVVGQDIDLSNGVSFKVTVPAGRTAEVCYRDDVTGATKENWQSFDSDGTYTNDGTADYEWPFSDPTWDGNAIRFYQLQMRMNQ